MADGRSNQLTELLAGSLEDMIVALGRGIGQAQTDLDRSSIAMQRAIDTDPVLAQHGLQATWYQMPRTELEIKVAFALQGLEGERPQIGIPPTRVFLQPINARYQNLFQYNASASSTLRLTIVPVPPRVTDAQQAPPRLNEDEVRAAATPLLEMEPRTTEPRRDARVVVSFNASSRLWFVLQFIEVQGQTTTLAVVEVNDETGSAVRR